MRECIFVIGTRAQLVKVAPVLSLASQSGLQHVVWLTGQHDASIDDLIDDFDIQSEFIRPKQQTERSSVFRLLLRTIMSHEPNAPLKIFLPITSLFFATGLGYYVYTYFAYGRFTNMSLLVFSASVIIFLIGLISEQITARTYSKS